jgi:predicted amidohydrolase
VITVTCVQLAPVEGDLAGNRHASTDAVAAAAATGADVIVLPELVTSGYDFESVEQAQASGISTDDAVFEDWARAGNGAVVVGGFAERDPDGVLRNSAMLVDGTGSQVLYRKTHLWDAEALYFTPGDDPPPVVDTAVGRIGVIICYDLEFPELTRSLALRGTELLAVPTNWPLVDRPDGEHPPEQIIAMAAARVNRMAVACSDRTHSERGPRYTEGSVIVDANGWTVTQPLVGVGSVTARIDLEVARTKGISTRNHVFDDRRPAIYR